MPDDINGNATRPPSPIPVTGQDADAPQINVPIDDIYACLTRRAMRDGRAPLLGNWNVNGYRMTNAGDAQGDQDYVTLGQAKTVFNGLATEAEDKSEPVDADFVPIYDSAEASALKKLTWASIKATLKAYFDSIYDRTPVGTVIWMAANTAPTGYLKCNGAAVSRTTYADLFSRIGTTFGTGDGSSTFNLPDLRGEFVRGWTDGRNVDSGRVFGSAQADEFKLHGHPYRIDPTSGQASGPNGGFQMRVSGQTMPAYTGAPSNTNGQQIGGSGGDETRPRNVALLACIKT